MNNIISSKYTIGIFYILVAGIVYYAYYWNYTIKKQKSESDYVTVNIVEKFKGNVLIKRKFENIRLVKGINKYKDTVFFCTDSIEILNQIPKQVLESKNKDEINTYYDLIAGHGLHYYSRYLLKNYSKIPDTIIANGFIIQNRSLTRFINEDRYTTINLVNYKYSRK